MTDEKVKILLCEDDENLGMLLREYLQTKGYDADLQPDGEAGFKAFSRNKYDLCVFDVMMPKKDGFALASDVRSMNSEVPIIFLTAKSMKEDILQGFKLGADDYLSKPFSMEELLYRIESILRRVKGKKSKRCSGLQYRCIYIRRSETASYISGRFKKTDNQRIGIAESACCKCQQYSGT